MRRLLVLLVTFFCIEAKGDDKNFITIWFDYTNKVAYPLSDEPILSFAADSVYIEVGASEFVFPLHSIKKITYECEDISNCDNIVTKDKLYISEDDYLICRDLEPKDVISIYNISGALIYTLSITQKGDFSLPLQNLTSGIYIIRLNHYSFKYTKK